MKVKSVENVETKGHRTYTNKKTRVEYTRFLCA